MKSDDTAVPNIPEVKTISPLSTPRGMKIIFLRRFNIFAIFFCI